MDRTGIAVGGPRDRVKLSAPDTWNGLVSKTNKAGELSSIRFLPGRYVWGYHYGADRVTWYWVPNPVAKRQEQ